MKAIWVNEGTDVTDWNRLKTFGVTHVFYDLHRHSRAQFDGARGRGFSVGAYTNPQMMPNGFADPKAYRTFVSQRLLALSLHDEQCDVQFNIEKTAFPTMDQAAQNQYVIDLFYWWRRSNAQRVTSWTMEGFQGGWFYPAMRHPNLTTAKKVPQAYHGNMSRWDSWGTVKDLLDWGVPLSQIEVFYDAPELFVHGSQGYYYMEHRLNT